MTQKTISSFIAATQKTPKDDIPWGAWTAQNAAKGSTRKYTSSGTQARQESPGSQKHSSKTSPSSLLSPFAKLSEAIQETSTPTHRSADSVCAAAQPDHHNLVRPDFLAPKLGPAHTTHPGGRSRAGSRKLIHARNRPQLAHPRGQNPSPADHERRPHWAAQAAVAKSSALISLPLVARAHSQCRRRLIKVPRRSQSSENSGRSASGRS